MNDMIEYDIHNGLTFLKVGIMNALAKIESKEESSITLGEFVPFSLVVSCALERGWVEIDDKDFEISGWECNILYYLKKGNLEICVSGCLWEGTLTKIYCIND